MLGNDKQLTFLLILVNVFGLGIFVWYLQTRGIDLNKYQNINLKPKTRVEITSGNMKITSSAFSNGALIPEKYTCKGENVNPDFSISGLPENTQSLMIVMEEDSTAITEVLNTFTNWVAYNIDPKTTQIQENATPAGGIVGQNDYGKGNYSGPCPPMGKRYYTIKLYALDILLDSKEGGTKNYLLKSAKNHILDTALLKGYFEN